ncbi:hypothetical protein D1872_249730 [compost metagenome]
MPLRAGDPVIVSEDGFRVFGAGRNHTYVPTQRFETAYKYLVFIQSGFMNRPYDFITAIRITRRQRAVPLRTIGGDVGFNHDRDPAGVHLFFDGVLGLLQRILRNQAFAEQFVDI